MNEVDPKCLGSFTECVTCANCKSLKLCLVKKDEYEDTLKKIAEVVEDDK